MSNGGRNLCILGAGAIFITLLICGVSLYVYHASGDIYLDRSRPGFLPEKKDKEKKEDSYTFSDSGTITEQVIDEYLKHLEKEINKNDSISSPFSGTPLSDESLGIPNS